MSKRCIKLHLQYYIIIKKMSIIYQDKMLATYRDIGFATQPQFPSRVTAKIRVFPRYNQNMPVSKYVGLLTTPNSIQTLYSSLQRALTYWSFVCAVSVGPINKWWYSMGIMVEPLSLTVRRDQGVLCVGLVSQQQALHHAHTNSEEGEDMSGHRREHKRSDDE